MPLYQSHRLMIVVYKRINGEVTYLNRLVGYNNNTTITVKPIRMYEADIWQGKILTRQKSHNKAHNKL